MSTVDRPRFRHLTIGVFFGAVLMIVAWTIGFPENPFYQLMSAVPGLRSLTYYITMPAQIPLVVLSGGYYHGGGGGIFLAGVFAEGVGLGALLSWAVWKVRNVGQK